MVLEFIAGAVVSGVVFYKIGTAKVVQEVAKAERAAKQLLAAAEAKIVSLEAVTKVVAK